MFTVFKSIYHNYRKQIKTMKKWAHKIGWNLTTFPTYSSIHLFNVKWNSTLLITIYYFFSPNKALPYSFTILGHVFHFPKSFFYTTMVYNTNIVIYHCYCFINVFMASLPFYCGLGCFPLYPIQSLHNCIRV